MTKYPQIAFTEIAILIRGVSYDKSVSSVTAKDDYIPILRANNIQKDLILNDLVYVPSDLVKKEQMIREGDIVLAMSSGSKDLVGKSAQANRDIDAAFGTFCGLIRAKENVDSKFLGLYFQTQEYRNFVSYQSKGVNICNLKKKDIESLQIPLPPLPTQHQIVSRIESLFAELDKAVEHLRTAQQQLKTYRQAVLNHWLNNEDGKWEMVKLGEVAEIVTGNTPPKKDMSLYGNDYPFYKPSDLNAGINTIHSEDNVSIKGFNASRKLPNGSILVTCIGATIGKTGLIHREGICNQQINAILPNDSFVPECLFYIVTSDSFQRQIKSNASATTLPILNKSKFSDLEFSLPPLADQHRIVQEIESRLSQAEAAEARIAEALQKTESLRQSILKKAFSGEFDL